MKIEAVKSVIVTLDPATKQKVEHKPGEPFDFDDKEAAFLISQGLAKKSGGKDSGKNEETPQEKAAREAAEKRKALEEKALELKVGTAEEIKALPDNDLTAKVNAKIRQVLIDKAVEAKLGTAEELAKLSDADLKDRIEKSGNEGVKGFFKNLFGGTK